MHPCTQKAYTSRKSTTIYQKKPETWTEKKKTRKHKIEGINPKTKING